MTERIYLDWNATAPLRHQARAAAMAAFEIVGNPSSVHAEGRAARPGLKIGVCGEHGGDPESVHFFHSAGLDYVSCSPFRVPVARLEAGRAALPGTETGDSR